MEKNNQHPYLIEGDYNNYPATCLAILFWAVVGFLILLVLWTLF